MELSRKTTILLSPELHDRLKRLAAQRGTSMGMLVREACEAHYGTSSKEDRKAAVSELGRMSLPVAPASVMKRESAPAAEDLLPSPSRRRPRSARSR